MKDIKGKKCGKTATQIAEERKLNLALQMAKDEELLISYILDVFDKKDIKDLEGISIGVYENGAEKYLCMFGNENNDIVVPNTAYAYRLLNNIANYFMEFWYDTLIYPNDPKQYNTLSVFLKYF